MEQAKPVTGKLKGGAVALFMALSMSVAAPALAADYPNDTIRIISAFPPGGGVDAIARYISGSLNTQFGQSVIVEDRAGAGGGVAATYTKTRPADGYSILHTITSTVAIEPVYHDVEYSKDDFDFVAGVVQFEAAIVAKADAPWKDLGELIEKSKEAGKKATFGGQTQLDRMVIATINKQKDDVIDLVPFKGGSKIISAVLGGHVDMGWSGTLHVPLIEAGEMKALAVVGDKRYASYPDVPTLTELGYPNSFNLYDIFAVPKGTPKDVIDKLSDAILKAVKEPGFAELCEKYNFAAQLLGPEETRELVESQYKRTQAAKEDTD
jgi:tripartite-type tricarboxylate transporter receptor subunit TctC